jgi:hypothetical protein
MLTMYIYWDNINTKNKNMEVLTNVTKVDGLEVNRENLDVEVKHNRSLKVAVQGPNFMAHPLYIYIYI